MQDDAVELVEETSPENDSKAQPAAEPLQQQPSASRGHLAAMEEQFECAVCKDWLVAPFSVHPCGHLLCGAPCYSLIQPHAVLWSEADLGLQIIFYAFPHDLHKRQIIPPGCHLHGHSAFRAVDSHGHGCPEG